MFKRKEKTKKLPRISKNSGSALWGIVWMYKFTLALFGISILIVTCMISYKKNIDYASASIVLNYEEASKGLNVNKTRMNMYEIKSEDVLKKTLELAGIEYLQPDDLKNNIIVQAVHLKSVREEENSDYIATEYRITYHRNEEITDISTDQMVRLLCKAYKDIFYQKYTQNYDALEMDFSELDNESGIEYMEIGEWMGIKISEVNRYISMRTKENSTFVSEENQETFYSLQERINNFRDITIEKYNSFVLESGLVKERDNYIRKLEYQKYLLEMDYEKYTKQYETRLAAINMYDNALISMVLIPTINESDDYYMSRTKIGIDYLAEEGQQRNEDAKTTQRQILDIENKLEKIIVLENESDYDREKAEEMISSMTEEMKQIKEDVQNFDREYIKYKTKDYLTISYSATGFFDKIDFKSNIVIAAVGCFCVYMLFVYYNRKRK